MAHARVTYTGNGSSTSYTVPFPFINRTHVVVTVNAVTQTLTTHYVWLNDSTIQFVTAPPSSQAVVFRRYTTITERLVDFHDAAVLTEADLDLNSLQGLYLSQERADEQEALTASTVQGVTGTTPIVSSGGTAPAVSITAATTSAAGSMSAADKIKIDATSGTNTGDNAGVTAVTGTAPVVSSGGTTPAISMVAATASVDGYATSTQITKLDGIATAATANGTVTGSGTTSGTNTGDQTNITGNAGTVTTNANLTGHVTSSGNAAVLGSFTSSQLASALTDETGSGAAVFGTSPTLTTPALGTPSALVGTNITGTGASFTSGATNTNANLTGHVTSVGNASTLNSFTSSELRGAITDETGTGVAVFATSPTLITPVLGTPASGNLANCTFPTLNQSTTGNADTATLAANVTNNANLTGHVTSVGNSAVLGSFSSSQLLTALSDETGSGVAVFDTAPTLASPTLTGTVTVPTPSNNTDAATKAYVDTIKQGSIDIKDSCRVTSTANIAIASALTNGSTIDGVTVATGDRVLLKNQTDASENGIYAVVASGAASRTLDANTNTLVTSGMYTYVSEGTAGNAIGFVLTTADPITLDTTNLTFTQFSSAGAIAAGTGMTKTSNTLDVIGTSGRIVANANSIDIGSDVALVANPLSQFGATTSAQLKGVLSDETGSGAAVFATSPTLVTPALGTPASGVVTNLTGTASININGTVGATTPSTVAATTVSATNVTASGFVGTGATDAIKLPVGTTAQQPTPATGMLRFNSTDTSFEGYDGAEWGAIGGGGGDGALGFSNNVSTVVADYTLATGNNASSVGPMTVATGVSVTIPTGSRWVIL